MRDDLEEANKPLDDNEDLIINACEELEEQRKALEEVEADEARYST